MSRLVAVLGSFRSDEIVKFGFTSTPELFAEMARALGAEIARRGHRLLSAWSNDHLEPQFLGGKYRFEATADYHALMGYLAAVTAGGTRALGPSAQLRISQAMWRGGCNSAGREVGPIAEHVVVGSLTLRACVERSLLQTIWVDGTEAGNLLRSEMLEVLVQEADAVIALGGGKATGLARFVEPHKWIGLDWFGGKAGAPPAALTESLRTRVPEFGGEFAALDPASQARAVETVVAHLESAPPTLVPSTPALSVDLSPEARLKRQALRLRLVERLEEMQQDLECADLTGGPLLDDKECEQLLGNLKRLKFTESEDTEFALWFTHGELSFGVGLLDALLPLKPVDTGNIGKLFVLHELAHGGVQGIRTSNYRGVGRAAVALEQVDYMADAFALRTLAYHALRRLPESRQKREAGRTTAELIDSSLAGLEAFDRIGGALRIDRLPDRRLRRYLIWHLQRARAATIREVAHLHDLFSAPLTVELAPMPGVIDPVRMEKVVTGTDPQTALFISLGGRLVRIEPLPQPGAARILEAVRTFDQSTLQAMMKNVIENHANVLAPWT